MVWKDVLFTIGTFGIGGLTLPILERQNQNLDRQRKSLLRNVDNSKKEKRNREKKLKSTVNATNNMKNIARNKRNELAAATRKALKEEKVSGQRKQIRDDYKYNIIPNLERINTSLQSKHEDTKIERNISDTKNKALLYNIDEVNHLIDTNEINIYSKTQQVYDQITKQNNYLEQTFDNLIQKRINLDRRSTYEEHIKTEYLILNTALWYIYYVLLIILFFMYRNQDKFKERINIAIMVGLLIFPYWRSMLDLIINILSAAYGYITSVTGSLSSIPSNVNRLFESAF